MRNKVNRVFINVCQKLVGTNSCRHRINIRIHYRQVKTLCERHHKKVVINYLSARQTKADIRYTKNCFKSKLILYSFHCIYCLHNIFLLRRSGKSKTIYIHIFFSNSVFKSLVKYFFSKLKSLVSTLWYAVFIKSKTYHSRTIFLYKRKNIFNGAVLSVYRIDDRLAIISPQSRFKHLRYSWIHLQRHIDNALQSLYSLDHHTLFVDSRQANIYIKNIRTCVYLLDSLTKDIVDIVCEKCFFKTLLASRIDTFANYSRLVYNYSMCRWTASGRDIIMHADVLLAFEHFSQLFDILRVSSAATSKHLNSQRDKLFCKLCKIFRWTVIFICNRVRKSCIRLYYNREICPLAKLLHNRIKLLWS